MTERHYDAALLDVDGTLRRGAKWNPGGERLLSELADAGVRVALCSGRTSGSMMSVVREFSFVDYLASNSGATVWGRKEDSWRLLAHRPLPRESALEALEIARRYGDVEAWGFTANEWLLDRATPMSDYEAAITDEHPRVADLGDHADQFGKILFRFRDPQQASELKAVLTPLPGVVAVLSGHGYLDVVSTLAHEAKGGDVILADLGIGWDTTIAAGDSENDRGMLSRAALAICVAPMTAERLTDHPGALRLNATDTAQLCQLAGNVVGSVRENER